MARMGPWSIAALLATLVLLFAFQGQAILQQPLVIALLAVPILIQVFFNAGLAYWLNRAVSETHSVACPSALIDDSTFSELHVAAPISLFGFHSGAALCTVVGVLIAVSYTHLDVYKRQAQHLVLSPQGAVACRAHQPGATGPQPDLPRRVRHHECVVDLSHRKLLRRPGLRACRRCSVLPLLTIVLGEPP